MSAELAATFFNVGYGQTLAQSMDKNQVDVLVLTQGQYMSILQDKAKNNAALEFSLRKMLSQSTFGQYWQKEFSPNAGEPWVGPVAQGANDALAIAKTLNAIGMAGIGTYIKTTATGTYIIIKGYSARRSSALQGTRYLATNPKMLQLGLGIKSLQGIAKGGFMLGVVVSTGIELMDFMFNDEKTMYDLVGGIGVEAVKGGLGGLIAYSMAAGVAGSATTVAVLPLIVMAVFAVGVGIGLNAIDRHYGVKDKVIAALKMLPEKTTQGIYYIDTKSQSWQSDISDAINQKKTQMGRAIDQGMRDWLCRISCVRY
ncbi:hypothetical protein AVHY2522_17370 [Acidovorax sp. SUPP2522]|uniref:hypothetical protein n=1 Tax=unclassified Acidovorax TaxID=2684926 RepID=UPI00234B56B7|nr:MULTISPECIES: hypothetical protein [unclassified Acidovorax]WCM96011.1 hypothetical protein M5C96_16280 [Acidovorax sp. GBBC 1281]GKT18044.1 hypothetical protein AVHY2522_17370 [Acidovorax sp. SUPP2522]